MRRALLAVVTAAGLAFAAGAQAKIPAPAATPEAAAKAAEAKAKAAEAAKKEDEQLGKAQDRAADNYKKGKGKAVATAAPPAKAR